MDAELGGEDEEEEEGGGDGDLTLGERVKALRLRLEEVLPTHKSSSRNKQSTPAAGFTREGNFPGFVSRLTAVFYPSMPSGRSNLMPDEITRVK